MELEQHEYDVVELEDSYAGGDWIVGHFVATPRAPG